MAKQKGFTLIELLVVVAIIGVLASVVLASLNSARAKARDTKRVADLQQLKKALEMYYIDYGCAPKGGGGSTLATPCPTGDSTLVGADCTLDNSHFNASLQVLVDGKYISSLPTDPINQASGSKYLCYNYSRVAPAVSGWSCGGVIRTQYLYTVSFSTENTNTNSNFLASDTAAFGYCLVGDRVL